MHQRMRSAAASGWSPYSCAIRLAQPPIPNRRTVDRIASVTLSAPGASDGCSPRGKQCLAPGAVRGQLGSRPPGLAGGAGLGIALGLLAHAGETGAGQVVADGGMHRGLLG
jgi:hypothetical protein